MVGWRRAFCTSIPRDQSRESIATVFATEKSGSNGGSHNPSPRFGAKFSFFSSNSNPSTPRLNAEPTPSPKLRCRTTATTAVTAAAAAAPAESGASSAKLQCRTTKSPRFFSNPPSPRSPSALSLLKSTLRLSKAQSRCGICLQSVKVGQGMAIFTAECSHAFHFPCIASRIAKNAAALLCPVCGCQWKEVPLLSARSSQNPPPSSADPHKKKIDSSPKKEAVNLKVYDDDEPLTTPTAGARFNPIPESDENDDDDEEFQGFFVPAAPVRAAAATPPVVSNSVDVRLSPETAVVTAGRTSETYAVVMKVKAPLAPESSSLLNPTRRAPIDLVTVLDVGGSVTGAKLQMVKSAMRLVISSLCSIDRLSIVAFSTSSKRLLPLRRMTTAGRRSARRIVDSLVAGHGHCSGDALKKAAKVLEDRRERNPVATIILLSDGPNEPISTPPANRCRSLAPVVTSTRFARLEIPVHAVGFGDGGACGHDQAAEDAFAKCVGGLLSVVVQDVRIQIGLGSGSAPFEIPAIYSCSGRPTVYGSGSIRLGDLYAEEERELLVELKVPASSSGARHVLSVRCSCRDPSSQEVIYGRDEAMLVAGPHAVRSSAAGPSIERLRNLFISTRAVAESRRLLERSDFGGAHRLLASARALLSQQSASASAEEFVRGLEAELAELQRRRQQQLQIHQQQQQQQQARGMAAGYVDEKGEPLTPTSAWRAAERLAKVAIMRKSLNRVSDLHGFENARF